MHFRAGLLDLQFQIHLAQLSWNVSEFSVRLFLRSFGLQVLVYFGKTVSFQLVSPASSLSTRQVRLYCRFNFLHAEKRPRTRTVNRSLNKLKVGGSHLLVSSHSEADHDQHNDSIETN